MSQNDTVQLAQEFLGRMGSGAEPVEIALIRGGSNGGASLDQNSLAAQNIAMN